MILWLAALAAALALLGLTLNARAYVRRAEARWPPQGRFVQTQGVRLHVREDGRAEAPRVLLIHGASANMLELWGPLAAPLCGDFHVIAYDRPGMGHSSRDPRNGHELSYQAQLAARVLEATGAGPALVVGHSLGAAIALRLALDFPQLTRGLVLVAPASHPYPGQPAWWARLAATPLLGDLFCELFIPWLGPSVGRAGVANNFAPADIPENYVEDAGVGLIFRPRAFRSSALDVCATKREFAAQAPRYPELLAPAVVVTAEKDRVVSPKRHARALAAELPSAELVIAPETGHMPHRLRTDLVIAAIRRVNAMASEPAHS